MKVEMAITCPHCLLHSTYNIDFQQIEQTIGHRNITPMILRCNSCSSDFVVNISYQFFAEAITRKVIPGNFTAVDNGEYIVSEAGCILESDDNELKNDIPLPPEPFPDSPDLNI